MRMRPKPWAESELMSNPFVIADYKGRRWNEIFNNNNPVYVEIGTGKGRFIVDSALADPDINYVGLERQKSVCAIAARKISASGLNNIRLLYGDASDLTDFFQDKEVGRLFINFCDPWPKVRTTKRRLTHSRFLSIYKLILKTGGLIFFKTDNKQLFQFSLNEFINNRWKIVNVSLDLHSTQTPDDLPYGNIMTEYERKFSEIGNTIYRIIVENTE